MVNLYRMSKVAKGAMHVATIRSNHGGKIYESHLIRQTYRDGGKVKHRTLANISSLPPEAIDVIRRTLRGEVLVPQAETLRVLGSRSHGAVSAVWQTLRSLGLDQLLGTRSATWKSVVLAMIVSRVVRPGSKRFSRSWWSGTTLPDLVGVPETLPHNACYEALDHLLQRQPAVERALAQRHFQDGCLVLYDVSSSYVEGQHCPLAAFGHNRDGKKGRKQITYGLLTDRRGCPVAIEVFAGNRSDPLTARSQIERLRERYHFSRVVLVGDRGMITTTRIADLQRVDYSWITCLRAKDIQDLRSRGVIQLSIFDERHLAEVSDPERPGERLIVCRNPWMAEERRRKRQELLAATEEKLQAIADRVAKGRWIEEDKIGLAVGKVVHRWRVAKHFVLDIAPRRFTFQRNIESIEREAALDGFYVVRTDVPAKDMTAEEAVDNYRSLQQVEQAFRSMKTTHLNIRPLYHWTEERVRAHAFLCMLAYYVRWHMDKALEPIQQQPAYGSFRAVLEKLGTIQSTEIEVAGQRFHRLTEPDAVHQRILDLLGVSLT